MGTFPVSWECAEVSVFSCQRLQHHIQKPSCKCKKTFSLIASVDRDSPGMVNKNLVMKTIQLCIYSSLTSPILSSSVRSLFSCKSARPLQGRGETRTIISWPGCGGAVIDK